MGTREDRPVKDSPAHGNGERLDTVFMYRHSGWWTLLFIPPTGIIANFHGEKNNRERVSPMLFVKLVRYENTYFLFRFISTTQIYGLLFWIIQIRENAERFYVSSFQNSYFVIFVIFNFFNLNKMNESRGDIYGEFNFWASFFYTCLLTRDSIFNACI